jgi:tetratricopeptide (TPR) repeat protein
MAESSGDIYSRALGYVCHGTSCFYKGFFTAAEEHLLKGIDLCERIQLPTWLTIGHQGLGNTYFETGNYGESQAHYQKAILLRQKTAIFPSCVNLNKMALARVLLAAGRADLDVPSLEQLLRTNRLRLLQGTMRRYLADILFHLDETHFAVAESWLHAAILDHQEMEMKWDLACDYKVFAEFFKMQGRAAEEKDYFDKSLLLFNECGAEGWRRRIGIGRAEGDNQNSPQ